MQCAAASHSITQLCSRFPTRVQQARAGRVAPRAVRTRAAEEDERPKRRYVKDEDAMTAEKDLYSLARASYGGPRGQQGAEDMFSGEHPIKRNAAPNPPLNGACTTAQPPKPYPFIIHAFPSSVCQPSVDTGAHSPLLGPKGCCRREAVRALLTALYLHWDSNTLPRSLGHGPLPLPLPALGPLRRVRRKLSRSAFSASRTHWTELKNARTF